MKNRSHRYDINRRRSRQGRQNSEYKRCLSIISLYVLSNGLAKFEAQFMKKLSSTETELKKVFLIKKVCNTKQR